MPLGSAQSTRLRASRLRASCSLAGLMGYLTGTVQEAIEKLHPARMDSLLTRVRRDTTKGKLRNFRALLWEEEAAGGSTTPVPDLKLLVLLSASLEPPRDASLSPVTAKRGEETLSPAVSEGDLSQCPVVVSPRVGLSHSTVLNALPPPPTNSLC